MHTSRFIPCLVSLLFAWLGCASNAHASPEAVARSIVERPTSYASAQRIGAAYYVAKTETPAPAGLSQGRVLFILASSKVHGTSKLPASISFGEVVHAWDRFRAAGHAVDFVSPDGGAVPILKSYVSSDVEVRLKDADLMSGLRNTARPSQIDPSRYRAVYYVGGSNAMYGVAENSILQTIAMHVYERNGGVVSAVCHGTAGIVNLKLADGRYLVAGKRITGYPEEHEQQGEAYFKQFPFLIRNTVEARGGLFHVRDPELSHVQVDGRVVTGQNYPSAKKVAEAVIDLLRELELQPQGRATAKG